MMQQSENDPLLSCESEVKEEHAPIHSHHGDGFGSKTIGTFAGSILLLNNMMGVGLPLLPMLLQQAGIVTPVFMILFVAALSGLAASMLTEAMKYLPGNRNFDDRVEYSSLAKFYLGKWPYVATQVLLNMALLSLNLVSILETIRVMDWTIVGVFKCTYGLTLYPVAGFSRTCPSAAEGAHCDSPFGNDMVIGLGYIVIVVLIIPMGYFNLDDNIVIQVVSCLIQMIILGKWVITFFVRGFHLSYVTAFGSGQGQGAVLGQAILNYAFVMTVPSWCNEKKRSSNVNKTIWSSVGIATVCYLLIGVLGALSFKNLDGSDILTQINNADGHSLFDQISVYMYPLIAVASSIPVYSIIMRYNLVENGICSVGWANFWAVIVPWVLVCPMTAGNNVFNSVSNFTSIAFLLPINFTVPFVIYILALKRKAYLKPCLCEPGPCHHDCPSPIIPGEGAHLLEPIISLNVCETDIMQLPHNEQLVAENHTQIHEIKVQGKKLRTCDRCCCAWYLHWRDSPSINPMLPFSQRNPRLARLLPRNFVAFLDRVEPPACDHNALPKSLSSRMSQGIGITFGIISLVFLVVAMGLAIWQQIDPIPTNHTCAL